jgi:hypothetical protein
MNNDQVIEAFRKLSATEKEQAIASMELIWEGSNGLMQELSKQAELQRSKSPSCPYCKGEHTIK